MFDGCSICGVSSKGGCRVIFDRFLALESEHPGTYGEVHHLTVICYMLQHNAYSQAYWLDARRMLESFVIEGMSPGAMRAEINTQQTGAARKSSITRGPKWSAVSEINWSFKIADVQNDSPERYCADVRTWAQAILNDTQHLAISN